MEPMQIAAGVIFLGSIFLVITGWIDSVIAALSGIILMILIGVMTDIRAFQMVDWNVIIILLSIWIISGYFGKSTTTQHGGFYETFMGDNGSLVISEVPQRGNWAMREAHAPEWDSLVKDGLLLTETQPIQKVDTRNIILDVRVTAGAGRWPLPVDLAKPPHQPHLENFFNAVRLGTPLSCPAERAFESAVAVQRVNDVVKSRGLSVFRPEQFKA